jgi:hypothetical protein
VLYDMPLGGRRKPGWTEIKWDISAARRWVDNIKIGCDGIDWIDLAQDRDQWRALVNTVINLRVP